jgi:hypothetical protein
MEMEKPAVKCPFLLRSKTERFYIDGFSRAFFAITRFLNLLKANVGSCFSSKSHVVDNNDRNCTCVAYVV